MKFEEFDFFNGLFFFSNQKYRLEINSRNSNPVFTTHEITKKKMAILKYKKRNG